MRPDEILTGFEELQGAIHEFAVDFALLLAAQKRERG